MKTSNNHTKLPILTYLRFDEPFLLTTDTSAFAIEAVLSQEPVGLSIAVHYATPRLNTPLETGDLSNNVSSETLPLLPFRKEFSTHHRSVPVYIAFSIQAVS